MAKRDRNTLKSYFKCGNMPQEEHFSDLIDSVLNLVDDQQPVVPTPPLGLLRIRLYPKNSGLKCRPMAIGIH